MSRLIWSRTISSRLPASCKKVSSLTCQSENVKMLTHNARKIQCQRRTAHLYLFWELLSVYITVLWWNTTLVVQHRCAVSNYPKTRNPKADMEPIIWVISTSWVIAGRCSSCAERWSVWRFVEMLVSHYWPRHTPHYHNPDCGYLAQSSAAFFKSAWRELAEYKCIC